MKRHIASSMILLVLSVAVCAQSQASQQRVQAQDQTSNQTMTQAQTPTKNAASQTVYLPSGLDIQIRINERLSSGTAQPGDTFTGTLVNSLEDDDGNIIFERGTEVSGRVVSVKPSGRLSDPGQLVLSLNSIRSDREAANLTTISKEINGASHTTSNTAKAGGGALLGAIIGGLAGGGKGAVIGAGAGAAAGTGAAAASGKKEAQTDAESILRFVTSTETTVVPANSAAAQAMQRDPNVYHGDSGPRDDNAPILRRQTNTNRNDSGVTTDTDTSSNDSSQQTSSTVARNTYPSDGPVLRRRQGSTSDSGSTATQPTTNISASTSAADDTITNTNTNTSITAPAEFAFSARDRRVITSCLAQTPGGVPAASPNAIPYHKGDTLPYAAQKQAQALPLACERQLTSLASNLERVFYNQQVLLINTNSLVLDSLDVSQH